jgi:hypothetical protein
VAREAGGLQFDDVVAVPQAAVEFPIYVPQVECGIELTMLREAHVAVTLKSVFSGRRLQPRVSEDIRRSLKLPGDAKVILLGIGKDEFIERIWGHQRHVFESIPRMGFSLVTALNYSIWFAEPRLEHLVNMKRSLLTFERLQALGIPAIPHVYWYNTLDLQRWADWLSRNDVDMISVNLQTARSEQVWTRLLAGIEWMAKHFPERMRYLIIGPSTYERMTAVRERVGPVTFCNKDAYILAFQRQRKTWNGDEFGKVPCDAEPAEIFRHNVDLVKRVVSGNPPPPFTVLDGFAKSSAVQARLPGMSTVLECRCAELPLMSN